LHIVCVHALACGTALVPHHVSIMWAVMWTSCGLFVWCI